ncbi:MAG: TolC family protein, partial [Alphaproteobacteria bacterium]|nr:TolC family protein [Alphaproteobacteria bacterium]
MKAARFIWIAVVWITCFGGGADVRAETLEQLVSDTVENHDRVLSSRAQVESARQRSLVALGVWYPNLNLTAGVERYHLERTGQASQIEPAQDLTATITQLLWDFGASNALIERARLEFLQSEIGLVQVRQDLTAEAISAYINLLRSAEIVGFAKQSEENIRRQTGLEEARIEAGSGLSTDLLQAKTQLAGAQARRVDAEGNYEIALNRYRAVFGDVPDDLASMPGIDIDRSYVPESLEAALEQAYSGNPQIRLTSLDISISQQDRIAARAESFAPTFEMVGERSMLKNDGGTIGRKNESSIKLQLSFPFNLGFTSINTLRAAQSDEVAATRTMGDLERTIEERVRNAWKQLETARLRSGYLFDQADIARAFLEVAIQERSLGQRSLIDVLSGETALINAQSDAVAAEAEVLLAMVELLSASGSLDYDVIKTVPRPDRSEMLAPIAKFSEQIGPDPAMGLLLSPTGQGAIGAELDPSAPLESSPSNQPV